MQIIKFVKDLEDLCNTKQGLLMKRAQLANSLKRAEDFFTRMQNEGAGATDLPNLNAALKQLNDIVAEMNLVERDIWDIDITIICRLEVYYSDTGVRFIKSPDITDAGDITDRKRAEITSFANNNPNEFVEITPEDLYFLKVLKNAFGIIENKNIELVRKIPSYEEE